MTARRMRVVLLLSTVMVLALARAAATAPPPQPTGSCSPGPADCSAWHTSNVTVTWTAPPAGVTVQAGCSSVTISSDTGGAPVSCTWRSTSGETSSVTLLVRRDATPPSVSVAPERGPDANGWYNRGLTIQFSGSDATSGVASCSSGAAYNGPDAAKASVSGSCTDNAGNTGGSSIEIRYDATAPTVEAKPNRPPDVNGWYNREVTIAFLGSDPVSGVDTCAPPVIYKGPDAEKTTLSGTCRDKAANTSQPAGYELKYDATPPALTSVKAAAGKKGIVLRWTASKDALTFTVVRRPGRGKKPLTVYRGPARTFIDRRIEGGVKYRYSVTAYDQAGNAAVKGTFARLGATSSKPATNSKPAAKPALTRPADGARVAVPPLVTWPRVPGATYYNFQLYRNGRKILSVWPSRAQFHLQASWRFDGRAYRLSPGRYRWYVWPGLGPRSANRYGNLIAKRDFVVVR